MYSRQALIKARVAAGLVCLQFALSRESGTPAPTVDTSFAPGLKQIDDMTFEAAINLLEGYPAVNSDGTVNFVAEIPTGTCEKWETKADGRLHWDTKEERPRVVQYLGYVSDYGMAPRTRQGDGDPIDVLVLAPAFPRGSVVPVNVIGVEKFTDDGEQDNKLLAVASGPPLGGVTSVRELEQHYPGVTDIVRIWFQNYKGPENKMAFVGMGDRDEALSLLADAQRQFTTVSR